MMRKMSSFRKGVVDTLKSEFKTANASYKQFMDNPVATMFGEKTKESMTTVISLLSSLKEKVDVDNVMSLAVSLDLLSTYNNKYPRRKPGVLANDVPFIKEMYKACKYANAAYGTVSLLGLGLLKELDMKKYKGVKSFFKDITLNEKTALIAHAGFNEEDVLFVQNYDVVHRPRHYVAIDHKAKSVVIGIRGTESVQDVLTDLVCNPEPFLDGCAHSGIAQGAEELLKNVETHVATALDKYEDYQLTVTGHSLGGGSSLLLTMLIKDRQEKKIGMIPNDTKVTCFAFAPPPVFSPISAIPQDTLDCMNTLVFNDDIVPRASFMSVTELLKQLNKIKAAKGSLIARMKEAATNKLPWCDTELLDATIFALSEDEKEPHPFQIPGKIFYIHGENPKFAPHFMIESNADTFSAVEPSYTYLRDHFPDKYDFALRKVIETMGKINVNIDGSGDEIEE
eukprot:TRINITY_DN274879_c0_g1_i1.p1 TRINITY_DN274879_c0_g1~~TRINITY_DN274879_c0_g1_i1.p1  ORF type:complete len:453 (-),score=142.64 TRINITY_DN274879_c0_g1_i1:362-1720(-)